VTGGFRGVWFGQGWDSAAMRGRGPSTDNGGRWIPAASATAYLGRWCPCCVAVITADFDERPTTGSWWSSACVQWALVPC